MAAQSDPASPPTRLARKLGGRDAVIVGLGSMIGAGVFSAVGPAVRAAGNAVVASLLIAGSLAYCNATSSATLAALYPESGGGYVYGRRRLGDVWGGSSRAGVSSSASSPAAPPWPSRSDSTPHRGSHGRWPSSPSRP